MNNIVGKRSRSLWRMGFPRNGWGEIREKKNSMALGTLKTQQSWHGDGMFAVVDFLRTASSLSQSCGLEPWPQVDIGNCHHKKHLFM